MTKANRKAFGKRDMEIILYGDVLHPSSEQITKAEQDAKQLRRQISQAINKAKFERISDVIKENCKKVKVNYIQRGFDIAKKWNDEYVNSKKNKNILDE